MAKKVQIDMDLFFDLCDIAMEHGDNDIQNRILDKLEKMKEHIYFTAYKRSEPGSQERENLRQCYLDLKGILPSFRSDSEQF